MEFLISLGREHPAAADRRAARSTVHQLGNRILIKRRSRRSARRSWMALISGGALIVVHAVLYPVLVNLGEAGQSALSLAVALALASRALRLLPHRRGGPLDRLPERSGSGAAVERALFGAMLLVVALVIVIAGGHSGSGHATLGEERAERLAGDARSSCLPAARRTPRDRRPSRPRARGR